MADRLLRTIGQEFTQAGSEPLNAATGGEDGIDEDGNKDETGESQ